MGTDESLGYPGIVVGLASDEWSIVLDSITTAQNWIREAPLGDPGIEIIVSKLVDLAHHKKWEVRRGVANAAAQVAHLAFEPVLARLSIDDNARVQQAAEHAALRRRDWRQSSALGKQHEERINSALDDIEVRFGVRGREAVKRVSQQIANTFARELYHELIKLLSPLAMSADRLRAWLTNDTNNRTALLDEVVRVERRIAQLRAVLDAMRAYTDQPSLTFSFEPLKGIVDEAASLALESGPNRERLGIEIDIEPSITVEVARPRLLQAITNVLVNAVEAYDRRSSLRPICVSAELQEGRVLIKIEDWGCGMSEEALRDARTLFATSKPNGTGFGLPLAVKIIEAEHGGLLNMESTKDNGTVVRVVIPAIQHE